MSVEGGKSSTVQCSVSEYLNNCTARCSYSHRVLASPEEASHAANMLLTCVITVANAIYRTIDGPMHTDSDRRVTLSI